MPVLQDLHHIDHLERSPRHPACPSSTITTSRSYLPTASHQPRHALRPGNYVTAGRELRDRQRPRTREFRDGRQADGDLANEAIDRWPPESQRLVVRFDYTSRGIVLGV